MSARNYPSSIVINVPGILGAPRWTEMGRKRGSRRLWNAIDVFSELLPERTLVWSCYSENRSWSKMMFESPTARWELRVTSCGAKGRSFIADFGWKVLDHGGWTRRRIAAGKATSLLQAARFVEGIFDLAVELKRLGQEIYSGTKWRACHPFKFGFSSQTNLWGSGFTVKEDRSIILPRGHGWHHYVGADRHIPGADLAALTKASFGAPDLMVEPLAEADVRSPEYIVTDEWGSVNNVYIPQLPTVDDFFASAVASSSIEVDD